jgi:hypothetical protein
MNRIVKASEAEFWEAFSSFCPPGSFFFGNDIPHKDIERRLVEAIDALMVPRLGTWQASGKWRHEAGVYRDGIRSLVFSAENFDPDLVPALQRLLVGEHDVFCILCKIVPSLDGPSEARIGSIAIRSNRLLLSYPLVKYLHGRI